MSSESSNHRSSTHRARSAGEAPPRRYNFTFDTGFLLDDVNFDITDSELDTDSLGSSPEQELYPSNEPRTAHRHVQPGRLHRINLPGVGTAHFGVNVPDERLPYNEQIPDANVLPELPREIRTTLNEAGEPIRSMSPDEREAATVSVGFNHAHPANRSTGAGALGPSHRRVGAFRSRIGSEKELIDRLSGFGATTDGTVEEYYERYEPRVSRPIATDASQTGTQGEGDKNGEHNSTQGPLPVNIVINIDYDPALLDVQGYNVTATPRSTSVGEEQGLDEAQSQDGEDGGEQKINCRMH
ncbi:hypothetical protein F5Y06DRAFT_304337 [Hypoxylon sp. FL0890]|nr:hypothetical protein F5Y06DRAFT_304337 [Hypoxylon sp. FL0890]